MLGTPVQSEVSGRMFQIEDILKFLVTEVTEIKSKVNLPHLTRAQQGVPPIEDSPAVMENENNHTSSTKQSCFADSTTES